MKIKLTDRAIAKYSRSTAYPPSKRLVYYDADIQGFCLVVQPSGVMSYILRYRRQPDGASREYLIGRQGAMTSAAARKEAIKKSGEVRTGKDIQGFKRKAKKVAERERLQTPQVFFEEKYKPYCEVEMRSGKNQVSAIQHHFVSRWPSVPLSEMSSLRLQNWRREKIKAGISPGGINRPMSALKAMLNRAVEWGVIESNPLAPVKPLKEDSGKNVRFLTDDEEVSLRSALINREANQRVERDRHNQWLASRKKPTLPVIRQSDFSDHLQPMVLLALNTGLRRGEIFNLVADDIEFDFGTKKEGRVVVRGQSSKSGDTRNVPLTIEARKILQKWTDQTKPEGLVFPSPVTGKRFDNINKAWKAVASNADLKNFRFHDLRHTFASKLAMRSVDLYTIKEFLGHASIETTQRYAHLAPGYKSNAIATLND